MTDPHTVVLWHRGVRWTLRDIARLIVHEGGKGIPEASAATGLSIEQTAQAVRRRASDLPRRASGRYVSPRALPRPPRLGTEADNPSQ